MGIPNSKSVPFTPKGLSDAFDATAKFPGACRSLANFVFDQGNPELIVARPGVIQGYDLAALGISSPGYVSCHVVIGTRIFGMVASGLNAGNDQPFCIETATNSLVAISGITAGNTPTSPATTGDWTPPTMAVIGPRLIITHPGFNGAGNNFFGIINLTTPSALIWASSNTLTNPLPGVPSAVGAYNNRAWYAVGNSIYYSDSLAPATRTNASQALTVGDSANVVAFAGQPVETSSSGVVSSLLVWKNSQIWQITGDTTTSNLALNFLSLNIGTNSPRSVVQVPYGVYFLSQVGGPYIVDPLGNVRALTYDLSTSDPDVQVPFQNASTPSRWAGGYIASTYRVCGPTVLLGQAQVNDYWFDEHRRRWNGPHSFSYDCASGLGSLFVLSSANNPGKLLFSSPNPTPSSVYSDLGTAYTCVVQSATLAKIGDMLVHQVVESQIELGGYPAGATYTITAQHGDGSAIVGSPVTITTPTSGLLLWGAAGATWGGGGVWNSSQSIAPSTYLVPWTAPLVFEKLALQISVAAGPNVQVGAFFARYQRTGYMVQRSGV